MKKTLSLQKLDCIFLMKTQIVWIHLSEVGSLWDHFETPQKHAKLRILIHKDHLLGTIQPFGFFSLTVNATSPSQCCQFGVT